MAKPKTASLTGYSKGAVAAFALAGLAGGSLVHDGYTYVTVKNEYSKQAQDVRNTVAFFAPRINHKFFDCMIDNAASAHAREKINAKYGFNITGGLKNQNETAAGCAEKHGVPVTVEDAKMLLPLILML